MSIETSLESDSASLCLPWGGDSAGGREGSASVFFYVPHVFEYFATRVFQVKVSFVVKVVCQNRLWSSWNDGRVKYGSNTFDLVFRDACITKNPKLEYACSLLLDRFNLRKLYGRKPVFVAAVLPRNGGCLSCPPPPTVRSLGSVYEDGQGAQSTTKEEKCNRTAPQRPCRGAGSVLAEPTCSSPWALPSVPVPWALCCLSCQAVGSCCPGSTWGPRAAGTPSVPAWVEAQGLEGLQARSLRRSWRAQPS